ncbi:MAG: hypothetical protein ABS36_16815 [Acidobacteria bacterium SCN 69-37]|nr:MAG: hypothetical protein ABS36_16815 [Acidobacteria bacterium SCN 69-37]
MRHGWWFLALAAGLGTSAVVDAQSFAVSAELVAGCVVGGTHQTSSLAFGTLDFGVQSATDATPAHATAAGVPFGGLDLQCTPGLALTVAVDAGRHASSGTRRLSTVNGDTVPYVLYADAGRQQPISIDGRVDVTIPAGGVLDLPIHAVAYPAGAGQPAGVYGDTLAVTVSW